jgi:hypothetical protein
MLVAGAFSSGSGRRFRHTIPPRLPRGIQRRPARTRPRYLAPVSQTVVEYEHEAQRRAGFRLSIRHASRRPLAERRPKLPVSMMPVVGRSSKWSRQTKLQAMRALRSGRGPLRGQRTPWQRLSPCRRALLSGKASFRPPLAVLFSLLFEHDRDTRRRGVEEIRAEDVVRDFLIRPIEFQQLSSWYAALCDAPLPSPP